MAMTHSRKPSRGALHWRLMLLALVLAGSGCGKSGVDVSELEKAFQTAGTTARQTKEPAEAAGVNPSELKSYVDSAVSAIQTNNYVGAVVLLQRLRSQRELNGDQLTAVQDTMAAVQQRLAAQADRGDAAAKKAMDDIRSMRRR